MFSRLSRPVARRLFSSDAPTAVPIPGKPKGWPTPWITEEDANNYLFPLYLRSWYIAAIGKEHSTLRTAGLACRFTFPTPSPASAFLQQVVELSEQEKHHPAWLKVQHSPRNSAVHICTTTHSALRPEWHPNDTDESRALEGLTLRDLRFAALISCLPTTPPPTREIGPSSTRPDWDGLCTTFRQWSTPVAPTASTPKTKQVEAKPSKTAVCIACGGPHSIAACSTRQNFEPPPCAVCGGPHWRVDCPTVVLSRRNGLTVAQARKRFGSSEQTAPNKPCPNCGGAHWKEDCRKPHAPPELLQPFEL
ncbi:hypothetical protein FB45DRAFT_888301 [Roridomyces roridus]|uniref:4a-hydroxytetrahydrobiopterin dehydratase n=1 Tax=Roridomyces roridus TaxID=1738132 RepID=A0AAD7CJT2_9AGAR|nr:hypothetical protein FB45DRAFT_888301 [Roridomyces roridus]